MLTTLDMSDPSSNGNRCAAGGDGRCLNRTWTDNLANFARRSGAKLVFGLNVATCAKPAGQGKGKNRCAGQPWDPTEAEALMRYLIKANHSVYEVRARQRAKHELFTARGRRLLQGAV